jgi:hypothetical protein
LLVAVVAVEVLSLLKTAAVKVVVVARMVPQVTAQELLAELLVQAVALTVKLPL